MEQEGYYASAGTRSTSCPNSGSHGAGRRCATAETPRRSGGRSCVNFRRHIGDGRVVPTPNRRSLLLSTGRARLATMSHRLGSVADVAHATAARSEEPPRWRVLQGGNTALEREKALEQARADRQQFKGSVMRLGDGDARDRREVIPTGSITLDLALGIGGLPRVGSWRSGQNPAVRRPWRCTRSPIPARRPAGIATFIDAEHALDPEYAAKLRVDIDALLVSQPDTGEQARRSPTCSCARRATSS